MSKKIRAGSSDPAVQKIMKAEKRIEDVPFDIEAWNVLIRDAQGKKIEEARPFFERLVVQVWFCVIILLRVKPRNNIIPQNAALAPTWRKSSGPVLAGSVKNYKGCYESGMGRHCIGQSCWTDGLNRSEDWANSPNLLPDPQ